MKSYQYVLLDWDGNLARTLDIWLAAYRHVMSARGIHKNDFELATSLGASSTVWPTWGVADIDEAAEEADKIAKQTLPSVELYPDAVAVLEQLHTNGKQLALISTSISENVVPALDRYNLHQYFQAVVTYEDTALHKPYPEPLEKALELLGGTKAQAVMVGDTDKDIGAAASAGIDSILFYPPEHEKFYRFEELQKHKPTYVVSDFKAVLGIAG